jgi:hypothetical protein
LRALLWPLFSWSVWVETDTVVAGTSGEGATLASFRMVDVSSVNHCVCEHDS